MNTIRILFATVVAFITINSVNAQSAKETLTGQTKEESVKVWGKCGMCKKRIETAALSVSGVQSATWNENTKILLVKYDMSTKDEMDSVQKKIASIGHDTEKYKATDAAYQALPDCCHYDRKQ
jgi:cation transport ATPase